MENHGEPDPLICAPNVARDAFAARFGLSVATVREWEQNRRTPQCAARVFFTVIANELNFFDDEAYRRRILVQLNRGEGRHMLARAIFHGKRGELRCC
jgi:hypothetical protein